MKKAKKGTPSGTKAKAKSPAPKADQPEGVVTRAVLAAALGVQSNRINKWAADGMPVAVPGTRGHSAYYAIDPVKKWLSSRARPDGTEAMSLGAARARLATAQAEQKETENLVRAGQLLERTKVAEEGRAVLSALKAKILSLPRQAFMRGIIARDKEPQLHALVVEALRELARWSIEDAAA